MEASKEESGVYFWPHYNTIWLNDDDLYDPADSSKPDDLWDLVMSMFGDGLDYELNWLFVGTSGVHGTYRTLDDAEKLLTEGRDREDLSKWELERGWDEPQDRVDVTIQIIHPRLVVMRYGELTITTVEQIDWLRDQVEKSIEGVLSLQEGSRTK